MIEEEEQLQETHNERDIELIKHSCVKKERSPLKRQRSETTIKKTSKKQIGSSSSSKSSSKKKNKKSRGMIRERSFNYRPRPEFYEPDDDISIRLEPTKHDSG